MWRCPTMPGRAGRSPHTSHVAQGLADTTRHLSCPEADCKRLGVDDTSNQHQPLGFLSGLINLSEVIYSIITWRFIICPCPVSKGNYSLHLHCWSHRFQGFNLNVVLSRFYRPVACRTPWWYFYTPGSDSAWPWAQKGGVFGQKVRGWDMGLSENSTQNPMVDQNPMVEKIIVFTKKHNRHFEVSPCSDTPCFSTCQVFLDPQRYVKL